MGKVEENENLPKTKAMLVKVRQNSKYMHADNGTTDKLDPPVHTNRKQTHGKYGT